MDEVRHVAGFGADGTKLLPILEDISLPFLAVACVCALAMLVASMARFRFGSATLAAMLFFASVGVGREWDGSTVYTWIFPIQAQRSNLYLATGLLSCVAVLFHYGEVAGRRRSVVGYLIIALGLFMGLTRLVHEDPVSAAMSVFFASVTLVPAFLLADGLLNSNDDHRRLLRAIAWSNAVWIAIVAVQIVRNSAILEVGSDTRFIGLLANPQHAAAYLALMSAVLLFLAMYDQKRLRFFWFGLLGINVILLVWSGSRTGAGMFLIGLAAVTYGRLGRAAFYLPLAAVAAFGAYKLSVALGVDLGFERLTSTENTRGAAWWLLLQTGMQNPLFGTGIGETEFSENSYLYVFAAYGFVAFGLLLLIALGVVVSLLKLFRLRRFTDPHDKVLIDLLLGLQTAILAGAVFEGYLVARIGAPLFMLLISAAMTSRLAAQIEQSFVTDPVYDDPADFEAYEGVPAVS